MMWIKEPIWFKSKSKSELTPSMLLLDFKKKKHKFCAQLHLFSKNYNEDSKVEPNFIEKSIRIYNLHNFFITFTYELRF